MHDSQGSAGSNRKLLCKHHRRVSSSLSKSHKSAPLQHSRTEIQGRTGGGGVMAQSLILLLAPGSAGRASRHVGRPRGHLWARARAQPFYAGPLSAELRAAHLPVHARAG